MRSKRFCSPDCKSLWWRAVARAARASLSPKPRARPRLVKVPGTCVVCSGVFMGRRDRRFCSMKCVGVARWATRREHESERYRTWRLQNAARLSAKRKANREQGREYARRYRVLNREKLKAYQREYRHKNPEKFREWQRRHDEKFHELRREASRRWRKEHPESHAHVAAARRARELAAPGKHTLVEWLALLQRCNYRCTYCGVQSGRLTRDHDVPLIRGGSHAISNIRPACARCNSKKGKSTGDEFRARLEREARSRWPAA